MANMAKTKITAQEFSELPEQPGFPIVELIDGEIILSASPIDKHQRIAVRIVGILLEMKLGGEVFFAPFDVHLDEFNVVEPDVMWIAENSQAAVNKWVYGAPDLIVEIHSQSTIRMDKLKKSALYEKHGVREYWMIDPEHEQVEVWVNGPNGFDRLGLYGKTGSFTSPVLGQSVDLTPVFR
ncbi:MAG: Uma2 family endonuclease [Anaerolineae bacterium]|nr:Uma2 family endonuclease [Anaerolineae bacterium]